MRSTWSGWLLCVPLLVLPLRGQDPAPRPVVPDVETLQREFDEAQRQWNEQNRAAREANDTAAQERLQKNRPQAVLAPKFAAAAEAHAGQEAAVPYLAWLVSRGPEHAATAAMTTLMDVHHASPGVRLAVARIGGLKQRFGLERSRGWLDRVLADNRDAHVRAQAHFTRAALYVGTRALTTSDALREHAVQDLRTASAMLAEMGSDGASLRGLVATLLDEAERLEPGLVAPDIEGNDLDGVPFKLSDYRGKVVLLDFWGDW